MPCLQQKDFRFSENHVSKSIDFYFFKHKIPQYVVISLIQSIQDLALIRFVPSR